MHPNFLPPQVLGRAEDVSSFVRRGQQVGEVTITLAGTQPSRPIVIKRRINSSDNTSLWWLNGRESQFTKVAEVVKELNIQVDNLCQFLPQDKVVSFAALKPVDLLRATEAAVGDATLEQTHIQLIEARQEAELAESACAEIEKELVRMRQENDRTEKTLAPIRERERLQREADDLQMKVPWVQYREARAAYEAEKVKLQQTETTYATMKAAQEQQDAPLREKKAIAKAAAAKEKKTKDAAVKADAARKVGNRDRQEVLEELLETVASKKKELEGLEEAAANRQARITSLQQTIAQLEVQTGEAAVSEAPDANAARRMKDLETMLKDLSNQELAIQAQMDEHRGAMEEAQRDAGRVKQQLERLSSAKETRLRVLAGKHTNIRAAYQWLQANKAKFRGTVLGPIAMEIEVRDPVHAAMLEQHVPPQWWAHFVVEHPEDQDLLRAELEKHCNYRANVSCYRKNPAEPLLHPCGKAADFVRFGVTATLDLTFQAPNLVKHVLNDNFYLSSTFVLASDDADWQNLFKACPRAQTVWTPTNKVSSRTSAYNPDNVLTQFTPLRPATLFQRASRDAPSTGGSGDERQQLEDELARHVAADAEAKTKMAGLQPQLQEVKNRRQKVVAEKESLNKQKVDALKRKKELMTKLAAKKAELARAEKQVDPLTKRPTLERELAAMLDKAVTAANQLVDTFDRAVEARIEHAAAELALREANDQVDRITAAHQAHVTNLERIEKLLQSYRRELEGLKNKKSQLEAAAKAATGWPIPDDLNRRLEALPNATARELQEMAEAKAEEAQGVVISDPGAMARYTQRVKDIARSEQELAYAQDNRDLQRATLEELKGRWLPEIRRIVEVVNASFSAAFPSVGVAGEVVLHEAPDDDFANYAIEIKVKFREGEALATLDPHRQSGGERSVSTILYLVALQGVAAAPFRVVDEINQGMDAANERKVFKQLVDAATAEGTPQCFLLTPKLLPDLPFASEVRTLLIMNGHHIAEVASGYSEAQLLGQHRMQALAVGA